MRRKADKPDKFAVRSQAAVSFFFYGADIILALFPCIVIGDIRCNLFGLAVRMKSPGLEALIEGAQVYADVNNLSAVKAGIMIELVLFGIFFLCGILYLVSVLKGRRRRFNIAAFAASFSAYYLHMTMNQYSILDITTDRMLAGVVPGLLTLFSGAELLTVKLMENWTETKQLSELNREKDLKEKQEKRERLNFDGRYNELFYRFIWKNFKSNWKDYILLLLCSVLVFTFIVIGFGLNRVLGSRSKYEGMDQIFGGLNAVLMNAIIPLGIISVIIIVILTFYYLRCRAKNYGIFLTLGMRRGTLQYFVAVEFISLLIITFAAGGLIGTVVLYLFCAKSETLMGVRIGMSVLGAGTYFSAAAALLMIYLIAFMAARDIFYNFNMGHGTDLNAVREEMPVRWRTGFFALGIISCGVSAVRYSKIRNFESVYLLLLLFIGIYVAMRYGITRWLLGERKSCSYLRKLMIHNQLFHRSKTNTRYIFAMAVVQFCALFYFSFQMISAVTAEDADELYPYDIVCMANDEDEELFRQMESKCKLTRREYPMVRISNYDSTEQNESVYQGDPPQGQHIGISESTYHALKKERDPGYQKKKLHLDAEGEEIYIVHQQDRSIKAQPIDFFQPRTRPLLHVGTPCIGASALGGNIEDDGYFFKKIKGEEFESLTGTFRQGLRDNLVVFSDAYFAQAKELWKTTDMFSGGQIPEDEEKIPGVNICQGPSRLVLINIQKGQIRELEAELAEFKKRHAQDEAYDLTVPCYYTKQEAVHKLKTERVMKVTMNLSVMIVSLFVYLVLFGVKMATEADMAARRSEFLTCMGMRAGERRGLIRREVLRYYYLLSTVVSVGFAVIYTGAVFWARQYTRAERFLYLKLMVPVWAVSLGVLGATVLLMAERHVRRSEGKGVRDGR